MSNNNGENKLMVMLKSDTVKERFIETVGRNGGTWITAIINAANTNPQIWECEPVSVVTAGLNAAALRLSLSPSQGHACILPFNTRNGKKATFIPMVRGLKQLAMRTDKYRYINSTPVYEGEEIREDRMTGIQYLEGRATSKKVIGYYAAFQFISGLTATEYMTVEECLDHAKRYSPSYNKNKKEFYPGSKWVDDFEVMAEKTVLRKLLLNKGYFDPGDRDIIERTDEDVQEDEQLAEFFEGEIIDAEAENVEIDEAEELKLLGF